MATETVTPEDQDGAVWPDDFLLRPEIMSSFWAKVNRSTPTECWPWIPSSKRGYGNFWCAGRNLRSDRVVFFYSHKRWPTEARHTCDNPRCCNPSHIIDGSHRENMEDCIRRGRFPIGENNGKSRLTSEQVMAILNDPRTSRAIAAEYGIGKSTVGAIKRGERSTL